MQKILRILPSWLFLFSLALTGNQAQVDVHQLRQQGLLPHSWQHFPVWAHQNYQQAADNIQPQPSTIRPSWPPSPSHQPVWPSSSNHQNPHGVLRRYPMPPEWPFHGRLPPLEMRQAPRKGLSRLLMLGGLNSGSDEQPELEPPAEQQPAQTSQPQLSSQQDMNRPPLANNMERYMPLLATKHRPKARNATAVGQRPAGKGAAGHHLVDSREHSHWRHGAAGPEEAEDEEGEGESLEAASGRPAPASELGPCVTANCRTWITITIPSELVGIPPGLGLPGEAQQKPDGQQPKPPSKPTISPSKTMPPFPPLPMPSRSRGQPAPKNRPSQGTFPSSSAKPPTTREQPPDFVFSTKWILPVNGLSIRPNGTVTATSPASPSAQITTATPTNPWANRPFTIRPKAKVPAAASSTASPPEPRERPTVKSRPAGKPWTHSGGSTGSSASAFGQTVPKARPAPPAEKVPAGSRPPTPDSTIEQAAIWASTELIDAIREALAKFRATLNRRENDGDHQDEQHRRPGEDLELDEAEMQLRQQLQAAWDSLRGTWLEHAVTELAQQADALGGGDGHRGVAKWPLESAKQQLGPEKTEVDQRRAKRHQIIGRTE